MKKLIKVLSIILSFYLAYVFIIPHNYSTEKAVTYLNNHAENHSRNMCALYVERAISAGGQPAFILPAWGYAYVLPGMGFKEVNKTKYVPQKGDIVVFPHVEGHIFGHIAMYNGKIWISDFKQHGLIVANIYSNSNYRFFRHK